MRPNLSTRTNTISLEQNPVLNTRLMDTTQRSK